MTGSPGTLPAPKLPSGSRLALIVGTSTYTDDSLRQLRAPGLDAQALADVLGAPDIGGFEVTLVLDRPVPEIRLAVSDFLADRSVDDLLVIYLSCHGLVDARRRLYFAGSDTVKTRLAATGLEATWLLEQLDDCRARRQIVILDCCFSGAFPNTAKGDNDLGLRERFSGHGRGRVVLTASRASEYSFEGEQVGDGDDVGSVFTTVLVEGLRTGAADADHDGYIDVDEAYDYAYRGVQAADTGQTPQRWLYGAEGKIILVRSAAGRIVAPAPLPETVTATLDSPHPAIRIGAVNTLGEWLTDPDPARALAAREALRRVADDDSPKVAAVAKALLRDDPATAAAVPTMVGEPKVPPKPFRDRVVTAPRPPRDSPAAVPPAATRSAATAIPPAARRTPSRPPEAIFLTNWFAGVALFLATLVACGLVFVTWTHVPGTVAIGANVASSPVLALPSLGVLLLAAAGLGVPRYRPQALHRALVHAGCVIIGLAPVAVLCIHHSFRPGSWNPFAPFNASFSRATMWVLLACASALLFACTAWWTANVRGWRIPGNTRWIPGRSYVAAIVFGALCALAWYAGAQPSSSNGICQPAAEYGSNICNLSGRASHDSWRPIDWLGFAAGSLLVAGCVAALSCLVVTNRTRHASTTLVRASVAVFALSAALLVDMSLAGTQTGTTTVSPSPDPFARFVRGLAGYTATDHSTAARLSSTAFPLLLLLIAGMDLLREHRRRFPLRPPPDRADRAAEIHAVARGVVAMTSPTPTLTRPRWALDDSTLVIPKDHRSENPEDGPESSDVTIILPLYHRSDKPEDEPRHG